MVKFICMSGISPGNSTKYSSVRTMPLSLREVSLEESRHPVETPGDRVMELGEETRLVLELGDETCSEGAKMSYHSHVRAAHLRTAVASSVSLQFVRLLSSNMDIRSGVRFRKSSVSNRLAAGPGNIKG